VDWGNNNVIVYSSIVNLSTPGDLTSELHLINPDGSGDVCITCASSAIPHYSNDQPAWHPSNRWIVFQSADGTEAMPGIDPSLQKQYLQGGYGYNNNLWVMRPDGSQFVELVQVPPGGGSLHSHFSPDGTKLYWSSFDRRDLGGNGWVLKLADFSDAGGTPTLSNIQTLTPIGVTGSQVYEAHDISADNNTILYSYSAGQPLDLDIYKTNLTTNVSTNLTNSPGVWDEHAHFTHNGTLIAWISSWGFPFTPVLNWQPVLQTEIWTMNADGGNQMQLTNFNLTGHDIAADLAWSPNDQSIVDSLSHSGGDTGGAVYQQVVRVDLNYSH
jgi:Tol biopolymer transport system component